jgi:putative PIN family toxin of toxin-antitoxin system
LTLAESGRIQLFVSREVLAEVEDVLNRPELWDHFHDLSDKIVGAFLKRLQKISTLIRSVPKKFRYPRDEDDEPYINLAVAAGADFILSRDRDLLDLMTGHADGCKEFRQRFRPLRVDRPGRISEAAGRRRGRVDHISTLTLGGCSGARPFIAAREQRR